jgi:site-specific recombinase XerD
MQYPPDPPRPEEIIVVMCQADHDRHGPRSRALIAVLWRAGLRITEALALRFAAGLRPISSVTRTPSSSREQASR